MRCWVFGANNVFDVVRTAEETSGRLPQVGIREGFLQDGPGAEMPDRKHAGGREALLHDVFHHAAFL